MTNKTQIPPFTPELLEHLRTWEGKTEVIEDYSSLSPALGLAATLNHAASGLTEGTELPHLWHWLYFQPQVQQSELGTDGHPKVGGFLPPVPLPRRMWAGGRLKWHAPLPLGERIRCVSKIESVKHKGGRSGDLVFVTVKFEISTSKGLAITEEKDLVYRKAATSADAPPAPQEAPKDSLWSHIVEPDPVLLFRYSALTFNGHRIHYDLPYATHIEGYPGLVVHGPLIATFLMDLARQNLPKSRVSGFSFKAVSPLFHFKPFRVCGTPGSDGRSAKLWAQDDEGRLAMQAEIFYEDKS